MAIIYTYPVATPTSSDNILGSRLNPVTEEQETVQFGIGEDDCIFVGQPSNLIDKYKRNTNTDG